MSEYGSAQPPVDYYAALGLDSRAPSHALLAQLSHRIAQTAPGPERQLMEQARAVLGDPAKRAAYDARLRDPQAPPWTPQELHALAMAQLNQSPASGGSIAGTLAAIPRRVLAAVASGLVLVLVLVVTLVSCTGGSADTSTGANTNAADASGDSKPAPKDCIAFTGPFEKDDLNEAAWNGGDKPDYTLVLTNAYQLPEPVGSELAQVVSSMSAGLALAQLRGGDIKVGINDLNYLAPDRRELGSAPGIEGFGYRAAYFTPQGELIDTYEVNELDGDTNPRVDDRLSSPSDSSYGVFRIAATDGITIPDKASNSKTDGKYALDVLTTGDDIWLLLRGGTALYKARLVKTSNGVDPTSCV